MVLHAREAGFPTGSGRDVGVSSRLGRCLLLRKYFDFEIVCV